MESVELIDDDRYYIYDVAYHTDFRVVCVVYKNDIWWKI